VIKIVRALVARENLGVLWATHLFDEVAADDHVVVLHKGRVLFTGAVPDLLAASNSKTISDAFRVLTGTTAALEAA
jgi:ABC-2 type transport system ATP-binding protein